MSTSRTAGVRWGEISASCASVRLVELAAELLAAPHAGAGDLVGHPERHALADQPLGDVGGEREALRRQLGHPAGVELQRRDHPGHRRQQHLQGVHGVEDRLLVLLQVAVVGQRQRLERREQPGQVPDQPAGLAAGELGDVGVLLLRHDARPRRPGVVQPDEAELPGRPEDQLLGEAADVHAELGADEGELGDEVPRRRAVDRVRAGRPRSRARRPPRRGPARGTGRPAPPSRTASRGVATQSASRSTSRTSGQACASRWWVSSTGWACCRCVRPGITAPRCVRPWAASASTRSTAPGRR